MQLDPKDKARLGAKVGGVVFRIGLMLTVLLEIKRVYS